MKLKMVLTVITVGVGSAYAEPCFCPSNGSPMGEAQLIQVTDILSAAEYTHGEAADDIAKCVEPKSDGSYPSVSEVLEKTRKHLDRRILEVSIQHETARRRREIEGDSASSDPLADIINDESEASKPLDGYKADGTPITQEDWLQVDMIARTLVGEIATKPSCSDADVRAVGRVILNRADMIRYQRSDQANTLWANKGLTDDPMIQVLTQPGQFDSVMRATDPAHKWFNCPATETSMDYKELGTTGREAFKLYKRALQVASEMVFNPVEFRVKTEGFTMATNFSQGSDAHMIFSDKFHFQQIKSSVDGKTVGNIKCVEIWTDPSVK